MLLIILAYYIIRSHYLQDEVLEEFDTVCNKIIIAQYKEQTNHHPILITHSKYLKQPLDELPYFLNLSVPNGDWIYSCDRRVWQTAVYSHFICRNSKSYFSVKQVDDWLQNNCNCKVSPCAKIIGMFGRQHIDLVPKHISENMPSSWATLRAYFKHLSELGVLIYPRYFKLRVLCYRFFHSQNI